MSHYISMDQAEDLLLQLPVDPRTETVPLFFALGRVLAEDFRSVLPSPLFDRSPFDGYAFLSSDSQSASQEHPVTLRLTEEIPAGSVPTIELTSGYAAKILTGAPAPAGATAITKFEETQFTADTVTLFHPYYEGQNIVRAGEDIPTDTLLAPKGSRVTPSLLSALAAQGISEARVYARPQVCILSFGSELLAPGTPVAPGKIYGSNSYLLGGYLRPLGVRVTDGGIVKDDFDAICSTLDEKLSAFDMVITTGGASVGDYDFSLRAAKAIGADLAFYKVNMKPGGSLFAAHRNGHVVLGLSGNPGASGLGLLRIGLPFVRKLCGLQKAKSPTANVLLAHDIVKTSEYPRIMRGHLELRDGSVFFAESRSQRSGSLAGLLDCSALAEIPPTDKLTPANTLVKVHLIDDAILR